MFKVYPQAVLALADGTTFVGESIGATGSSQGEVVFNTSMTGYQEMLTDPSYSGQILTLTYPHIGNYGTNAEDVQSSKVHAAGLVIKDLPILASNFRSQSDLQSYLKANQTVAIAGIDTRQLTRLLRDKGAQNGCIVALPLGEEVTEDLLAQAVAKAKAAPNLEGQDLAKVVSSKDVYHWAQCGWSLQHGFRQQTNPRFHVVALDFGVKNNILCMLADKACKVTVVPAQTSAQEILALRPDGVFLSNGPGDPLPCDYAIACIKELLSTGIPIFGICLGHQLLSIACGAKSFKMKFGHHGGNHPVKDLATGKVCITSQNHGFAIEEQSLPDDLEITHVSLFDGTIQGIKHKKLPAFSFQGHPETAPGPNDVTYLFDNFVQLMEEQHNA